MNSCLDILNVGLRTSWPIADTMENVVKAVVSPITQKPLKISKLPASLGGSPITLQGDLFIDRQKEIDGVFS